MAQDKRGHHVVPESQAIAAQREMADRFASMEQKWREANDNQKASINRLMEQRQKALSILNDPANTPWCNAMKTRVIAALNGEEAEPAPAVQGKPNLAHLSVELKWHEDRIGVYDEKAQERFRAMRAILSGEG